MLVLNTAAKQILAQITFETVSVVGLQKMERLYFSSSVEVKLKSSYIFIS